MGGAIAPFLRNVTAVPLLTLRAAAAGTRERVRFNYYNLILKTLVRIVHIFCSQILVCFPPTGAEFSADDPWCNARSENCEDCNGYWIDPDEDCLAMWSDCTTSAECCGTAECLDRASDGWRHCNVPSNM